MVMSFVAYGMGDHLSEMNVMRLFEVLFMRALQTYSLTARKIQFCGYELKKKHV